MSFESQSALPPATGTKSQNLRSISQERQSVSKNVHYVVCSLVLSVSIYVSFQIYRIFYCITDPRNPAILNLFYITILSSNDYATNLRYGIRYFIKSDLQSQKMSQWSVQQINWYVNRCTDPAQPDVYVRHVDSDNTNTQTTWKLQRLKEHSAKCHTLLKTQH
jgi:hypothetical protein